MLQRVSGSKIRPHDMILVARAHNEMPLLPEFLNHYRELTQGNISFLIIDDYSTDETKSLLSAQSDVTLYHPMKPMTFLGHSYEWVTNLLNQHGNGKWCLTPDVDEHLIYRNMDTKTLFSLIDEMEQAKVDALPAIMFDMYADKLLVNHAYEGGGLGLRKEFPLFDAFSSYGARAFKNGRIEINGGPRHRMFYKPSSTGSQGYSRKYADISSDNFSRPKRDGFFHKLGNSAKKRYRKLLGIPLDRGPFPLNNFKTPLLVWRNGMKWRAHGVTRPKAIFHRELAALLHYHLARGLAHYQRGVNRRRRLFNSGPKNHLAMALSNDWSQINPVCHLTRTYTGYHSLFDESLDAKCTSSNIASS